MIRLCTIINTKVRFLTSAGYLLSIFVIFYIPFYGYQKPSIYFSFFTPSVQLRGALHRLLKRALLFIGVLVLCGLFSIAVAEPTPSPQPVISNAEEISIQLQGMNQAGEENLIEAESLTEAGASCTTPECLNLPTSQSVEEILDLCLKSLPQYCKEVKPEFTKCYKNEDESFAFASVKSVGACLAGGIGGVVDFFVTAYELGGAFGDLFEDSYYRDEALDIMSYIMEQIMDSEEGIEEVLKEFLLSPALEEIDEFISCLNYKGRWEYVCESGVQIYLGVKAVKVGRAIWRPIKNRRKFRLSFLDQLKARRKLKKQLKTARKGDRLLDIRDVGPYGMTILSKKDMKFINVRFMTDKMAERMSRRQLQAIPLNRITDLSARRAGRVFSRLSNRQFKAIIDSDPSKIKDMSMYVVERNLRRIDPRYIANVNNINQMAPSAFGRMSAEQIRALSAKQLREITSAQRKALKGVQKQTFDEMYNSIH